MNPYSATVVWLHAGVTIPRWVLTIGEGCAVLVGLELIGLVVFLALVYMTKKSDE